MFKKLLGFNLWVLLSCLLVSCASTDKPAASVKKDIQTKGVLYPKIVTNEFLNKASTNEKLFVLMYSKEGNLNLVPADDPSIESVILDNKNHQSILSEPLTSDLSIIYVLDSGSFASVISSAHLKAFNLSLSDVKGLASKNIDVYASSPDNKAIPVSGLNTQAYRHNGKYESSLMLSSKFIETLKVNVKGDLVVFIPVSSAFLHADASDIDSLATGRGFSKSLIKQLPNPLISKGLVLKDGSWVVVQ